MIRILCLSMGVMGLVSAGKSFLQCIFSALVPKILIFTLTALCLFSCKNGKEHSKKASEEISQEQWTSFENESYQIVLKHPENYKITEASLAGDTPVVNVYNTANKATAPYGIHEGFNEGYIALLPKGFGVDGPGGDYKKLSEFGNPLPLSFEIDPEKSTAYLLKNGQPWGFYLSFYTAPDSWSKNGGIFIRYPVSDFEAVCISNEEEIDINDCDPMGGEQRIEYRGQVVEKSKMELNEILKTLYFERKNFNRRELNDLIRVDFPEKEAEISSPLKIKGEARGIWFFEANAGIEILNEDYIKIGEGYIKVENANWMTEDFVPFSGEVSFKQPDSEKGYIVFKKANASGKPELDRIFSIPVSF